MSNSTLVPFCFEDYPIRVVMRDGAPWFVAADVCAILGLANPTRALSSMDSDEKTTLHVSKGHIEQGLSDNAPNTQVNIVSESGLYSLIFKSRKSEAKVFRKWITSEVLPSIRRDGGYISPTATPAQARRLSVRAQGIVTRKVFTDTLKAHGVKGPGYALCTNAIYQPVLGATAAMVKAREGLPAKANLRDALGEIELAVLQLAELVAEKRIVEQDVRGNRPCAELCGKTATAIVESVQ